LKLGTKTNHQALISCRPFAHHRSSLLTANDSSLLAAIRNGKSVSCFQHPPPHVSGGYGIPTKNHTHTHD
jgi:hypothetical protein